MDKLEFGLGFDIHRIKSEVDALALPPEKAWSVLEDKILLQVRQMELLFKDKESKFKDKESDLLRREYEYVKYFNLERRPHAVLETSKC